MDGLGPSLQELIGSIAWELEVESAAIFTVDEKRQRLEILASFGLGDSAVAGLAAAVGNPAHPIARTVADPVATFDVLPTVPGGPARTSCRPCQAVRHYAVTCL